MSGNGDATAMVQASKDPGLAKVLPVQSVAPAWIPRSMKQVGRLAEIIVESGLAPRQIMKQPHPRSAAFVVITTGLEMGLGVMQSLRHIFVTPDGKVGVSASIIVARVKRSPVCKYFHIVSMSSTECTCETLRVGDPAPTRLTWAIDDAKRAGLLNKDNWKGYPRAMLRNRCQAELARAVYPDEVDGVCDPDELGAITTEDGEIIEVRQEPSRPRPPPPPSEPKPAPDTHEALKEYERRIGDVVTTSGTEADLKAIGAEIASSKLDAQQREYLDEVYIIALEAIQHRGAESVR